MNSPVATTARPDDDDREVIEPVAERILARLRARHVVPELAQHLGLDLGNVLRADPDRPEVEPERRVDDVEDDRRRSARARPSSATAPTANLTPTIGRNAVNSSTNIDAAMTQWNSRAAMNACRSILVGQVLVRRLERVGLGRASACGAPRAACSWRARRGTARRRTATPRADPTRRA